MAAGVLRVVQVQQHLRRKHRGAQQITEAPQRVRGDDALGVIAHHRADIATTEHIEMIQPEPAQPLLQGIGGVQTEPHLLRRGLLRQRIFEAVERLQPGLGIGSGLRVILAGLEQGALFTHDGRNERLKRLIHRQGGKLRRQLGWQRSTGLNAQLQVQIGRGAQAGQRLQLLRAGAPAHPVEKGHRIGLRSGVQRSRASLACGLQGL